MKRLSILFSLFMGFAMSQSVWAEDAADIQSLLKNKVCPGICNLYNANLDGADLSGADFGRSDMRGLQMRNANLIGAILTDVSGGADLIGSDLTGADMRWVEDWTAVTPSNRRRRLDGVSVVRRRPLRRRAY